MVGKTNLSELCLTAGRLRPADPAFAADEEIDAAVDAALRDSGFEPDDVPFSSFADGRRAAGLICTAETHREYGSLLSSDGRISDRVRDRIRAGAKVTGALLAKAERTRSALRTELAGLFERYPALALPTLVTDPPPIGHDDRVLSTYTTTFNLAGVPVLTLPVPRRGALPASIQLVGPPGGEERLLAMGRIIEEALS